MKLKTSKTNGWKDAYDTYGVFLNEEGLSRLMTPAPNKQPVSNKSELEHGKRVVYDQNYVMKDERTVTVVIHLKGNSKADFMNNYVDFCKYILDAGFIWMKTGYMPDVVYKMTYVDCTQFSEFQRELAKFTLTLNEANPADRKENEGAQLPSGS